MNLNRSSLGTHLNALRRKWFSREYSREFWRAFFARRVRGASKYRPHQNDRECARRRGEIGWQARGRT